MESINIGVFFFFSYFWKIYTMHKHSETIWATTGIQKICKLIAFVLPINSKITDLKITTTKFLFLVVAFLIFRTSYFAIYKYPHPQNLWCVTAGTRQSCAAHCFCFCFVHIAVAVAFSVLVLVCWCAGFYASNGVQIKINNVVDYGQTEMFRNVLSWNSGYVDLKQMAMGAVPSRVCVSVCVT